VLRNVTARIYRSSVTRIFKNLPNFWNCGQNIKAQIKGQKRLHLTAFECLKMSSTNDVENDYLG
jgi:hypothetical protein